MTMQRSVSLSASSSLAATCHNNTASAPASLSPVDESPLENSPSQDADSFLGSIPHNPVSCV